MKKIFTLSTCDTSKRILKESGIEALNLEIQDIKKKPISASDLDSIKQIAGTYEALFSRRAQKYKVLGLNNLDLKEEDYRKYILEHYTFLKRPVIIDGENLFIGNSKKSILLLANYVQDLSK